MALNGLGLGFLFTATDLASGVMDTVGKSFKSLEEQSGKSIDGLDDMIGKLGTGLTTAAIGVGGLMTSFSLAGKAAEFEQALAAVGAVSNATAEEMKELEAAAMAAGKSTQFSPTEAILGLNELTQAGYDVKESVQLLNPVLALAAGSLGDLSPQEAAGLASQALKAFGIDASLAGRAVDQLLQSANAFAVKPADLALGLGTASSGAQTLNQSLTETVIAFGLVKNVIPGTERAATSVKVAMERLAKPDVQKALKAQGVAVLDAEGNYRQFLDVIKDMMPAIDKMTEGQKGDFMMKIFGTEGLSGVNAMLAQFGSGLKGADGQIRKGGEAIDYLRHQFASANGVAEEFSKKLLDTYEGSQKLLAGSMETLAISIGKPFKDMLRPVLDFATRMINGIIDLVDAMGPTATSFFAALFVGASSLFLLGGGLLIIEAAGPLVAAGFAAMSGALGTFAVSVGTALLAAWPFIAAGLVLVAVFEAISYAVENNIGGIGDAWARLTESASSITDGISARFETFGNYVSGAWGALKEGFSAVYSMISPVFQEISGAFDFLGKALGDLGSSFGNTTSGPGEGFLSFFRMLGNVIGWVLGILLKFVKWGIYVAAVIVEIAAVIAKVLNPIVQGIADALGFWIDKIMAVVDLAKLVWKGALGQETGSTGERGMGGAPKAVDEAPKIPSVPGVADADGKKKPGEADAAGASVEEATAGIAALKAAQPPPPPPIDYDKLAATLAKQPINVSLMADGEKLASVVARGQRTAAARAGMRDHDEG